MSDEPLFEHICAGASPLVDVIFVHGLTGDPRKTWSNEADDDFWLRWLQSDLDKIAVYTLGYPASLFEKWAKKEMDMFERAGNVLERFAGNGIGEKPIAFVAHSLGGILTKMILRKSREAEDEDWKRVSEATKLVIFLGVAPFGLLKFSEHTERCSRLMSKHIKLLANLQVGFLEDLSDQYRALERTVDQIVGISLSIMRSTRTNNSVVAALQHSRPRPRRRQGDHRFRLATDHINVCKPPHKDVIAFISG